MAPLVRIAITTGDLDGIGLEIASKALNRIGPQKGIQFVLWRSTRNSRKELERIDRKFKRRTVSSWAESQRLNIESPREIVDISSALAPGQWVELSAEAAMLGQIDGLATAPISKSSIREGGLKDIGHTDILKRVSGVEYAYMSFIGKRFSVVLATGHIPLKDVHKELTEPVLEGAVEAALELRTLLDSKKRRKPLGLLGLNPHAGEDGIIGSEELNLHQKLISRWRERGEILRGPLPPDTAFFEEVLDAHSVYVAGYHDQGLIPFKALHGHEANVHITMGLPFIRTSVDHGTAKDIFGKNRADPSSMVKAIEFAIKLTQQKRTRSRGANV